mmetsp:Transcript_91408/g.254556  ORF Transcript_91408/g.254556 Transcript_91408/m.254556 type:complete len:204 (+) Transcript_91408:106-717(+)
MPCRGNRHHTYGPPIPAPPHQPPCGWSLAFASSAALRPFLGPLSLLGLLDQSHHLAGLEGVGLRVRLVLAPTEGADGPAITVHKSANLLQCSVLLIQALPCEVEERAIGKRVAILPQQVVAPWKEVWSECLHHSSPGHRCEAQLSDGGVVTEGIVTLDAVPGLDALAAEGKFHVSNNYGRVVCLQVGERWSESCGSQLHATLL